MAQNFQPGKELYRLLYETPHRELGGHTIFSSIGRYHDFGKYDELAVLIVFEKELAPDELGKFSPKNIAPVKETAAHLGLVLGGIKEIDDFPDLKNGLRKAITEKIKKHSSGLSTAVLKDTLAIYDYLTGMTTLKEAKQLSQASRDNARGPSNLYVGFLDPRAARDPKTNLPISYFETKSVRTASAVAPRLPDARPVMPPPAKSRLSHFVAEISISTANPQHVRQILIDHRFSELSGKGIFASELDLGTVMTHLTKIGRSKSQLANSSAAMAHRLNRAFKDAERLKKLSLMIGAAVRERLHGRPEVLEKVIPMLNDTLGATLPAQRREETEPSQMHVPLSQKNSGREGRVSETENPRAEANQSVENSASVMKASPSLSHPAKKAVELYLTSPQAEFGGQPLFKNKMALAEAVLGMPSRGEDKRSPKTFTRIYQRIDGAFKTGNQLMSGGPVYKGILRASIERIAALMPAEKVNPALVAFAKGFRQAITEQFYPNQVDAIGIPTDEQLFIKAKIAIASRVNAGADGNRQQHIEVLPTTVRSPSLCKDTEYAPRTFFVHPPTELNSFLFGTRYEELGDQPLFKSQIQIANLVHGVTAKNGPSSLPAHQVSISHGLKHPWLFSPGNSLHEKVKMAVAARLPDQPQLAEHLISKFVNIALRLPQRPRRKNQSTANQNERGVQMTTRRWTSNGAPHKDHSSGHVQNMTPPPSRQVANGLKTVLSGLHAETAGNGHDALVDAGTSDIRQKFLEATTRVTRLEQRELVLVEALQKAERELSVALESIQRFQQQAGALLRALGKTAKVVSNALKTVEPQKFGNGSGSHEPTVPRGSATNPATLSFEAP